jgi:hypothetical protein
LSARRLGVRESHLIEWLDSRLRQDDDESSDAA